MKIIAYGLFSFSNYTTLQNFKTFLSSSLFSPFFIIVLNTWTTYVTYLKLTAIANSVETTTDYLLNHECIAFPKFCEQCGAENNYSWKNQNLKTIRCRENKCRKQFSIYKGTCMSGSRSNVQQVLLLTHSWLKEDTVWRLQCMIWS